MTTYKFYLRDMEKDRWRQVYTENVEIIYGSCSIQRPVLKLIIAASQLFWKTDIFMLDFDNLCIDFSTDYYFTSSGTNSFFLV